VTGETGISPNTSVDLAPGNKRGLKLSNPVMTASGTFGYGIEFEELFDIQRLGAIVCKGTTLSPREGNAQPRIAETPSGMLNSIGLQNIGVEVLIADKAPAWATWRVPVIVNIAGNTVEEYVELAEKLDGVPGVSGLEVNISCPNVKEGGAEFGIHPESAARVTEAVRKATTLPLLVKLTPNTGEIVEIAQAVSHAGADAVTLINTIKGIAIDVKRRRPVLGNITGGLSGPAIKPVALNMVYQVSGKVSIPVVGCGGISSARDAIEFIMAGATAVEVGAANFAQPLAALHVLEGIEQFMIEEGLKGLSEITGIARVR
jgi:dihydroorotate dehydrogenase (NAD+) catalytic subunit